jgi:hypothetical protein
MLDLNIAPPMTIGQTANVSKKWKTVRNVPQLAAKMKVGSSTRLFPLRK